MGEAAAAVAAVVVGVVEVVAERKAAMLKERLLFGRKCKRFTLQWHITNKCRFHCAHCYDRTERQFPEMREINYVLSELLQFCRKHHLLPHISLTGGDPFCHPHIYDIINKITNANITYSILGNPLPDDALAKMQFMQYPRYYQVSLEGTEEYNDSIRGKTHYQLTIDFLKRARKLGFNTHVMLTLSSDNITQVIPLGISLEGIAMGFSFNRISLAGEAKNFIMPNKYAFINLLHNYTCASHHHFVLAFKDNLFNILRYKNKKKLFGGCTGYGCGAAFNFVALLPDGEVHACRKFPSLLGNIYTSSLEKIYFSEIASQYRRRPVNCRKCPINKNCGGCMASTWNAKGNPFVDRDPYCFIDDTLFANNHYLHQETMSNITQKEVII